MRFAYILIMTSAQRFEVTLRNAQSLRTAALVGFLGPEKASKQGLSYGYAGLVFFRLPGHEQVQFCDATYFGFLDLSALRRL